MVTKLGNIPFKISADISLSYYLYIIMADLKRQLFFSHSWKNDNLGRSNHIRVYKMANILKNLGYTIWIDEDDMIGDIDYAMFSGIENSSIIMVCLSESYFKKISYASRNPHSRDNCYKEWTYSNAREKMMLPVIMEPSLKNIAKWPPSVISLYFASQLYIDCTNNDLHLNANNIVKYLKKLNFMPERKTFQNTSMIDKKMVNRLSYKTVNKFIVNFLLSTKITNVSCKNIKKLCAPKKEIRLYKKKWGSTGQLSNISI